MNDYNKYINILNNNLDNNIKNSHINEKFMKLFYNDLNNSYKITNDVLKNKDYTINISKFKNKNLKNNFFPDLYNSLLDKLKFKVEFIFKINNKNIVLSFYVKDENMNFIYTCFRNVYTWLNIVNKYSTNNCFDKIKIDIFFIDVKKKLPNNKNDVLDVINVNSAFTKACGNPGEIIIYRKEEWFKVLIHETFHAYGLDYVLVLDKSIYNNLINLFNINSKMEIAEAYTEIWATIWNICFSAYNIENNINISDFCNYFIYYINIEQQHSLFQCSKILKWMDLTYSDLINNKQSHNYSENTNVFTYYILKTILLSNLNDFIRFCNENNSKLLNFNNTPKNIKLFNSFLIKHIKSNKSKKMFNSYFDLYMNTKTNNFYFNKSLRMTTIEFI